MSDTNKPMPEMTATELRKRVDERLKRGPDASRILGPIIDRLIRRVADALNPPDN